MIGDVCLGLKVGELRAMRGLSEAFLFCDTSIASEAG